MHRNTATIESKDISVVVQGMPCAETLPILAKIRKLLPKSEIILSTWEGVDAERFEGTADRVVLSKDPGSGVNCFSNGTIYHNNFNRQLVSTRAGIRASTRKFVIKTRTDFSLDSLDFLTHWDDFPVRNPKFCLFNHRIIVPSLYSRFFSDCTGLATPFHPSDIFAFGLKEDISLLFCSAPLMTDEELSFWAHKYPTRNPYPGNTWRWSPEQTFFIAAVKTKFPDVHFDDWTDFEKSDYILSEHLILNNFVFLDPCQIALNSKKHQHAIGLANNGQINGLITNNRFMAFYARDLDPDAAPAQMPAGQAQAPVVQLTQLDLKRIHLKHRYHVHKQRAAAPIKAFFHWLGEPFCYLYYLVRYKLFKR